MNNKNDLGAQGATAVEAAGNVSRGQLSHAGQDVIASRIVCAWCKSLVSDGVDPTSHGICSECANVLVGDTWHVPVIGPGIDSRWLDAYIATQLQDVFARRYFSTPFPKLSTEDRAAIRMRVEGFVTSMSIIFKEREGRGETVRALIRDMELFQDVRRG